MNMALVQVHVRAPEGPWAGGEGGYGCRKPDGGGSGWGVGSGVEWWGVVGGGGCGCGSGNGSGGGCRSESQAG